MRKKFIYIVATTVIACLVALIMFGVVSIFNMVSAYAATEKGTYQMVKINEFDIGELNNNAVVELVNSESSDPKYQYLRHMKHGSKIGSLPANRTTIHEELVNYRVEVYQKKPNLWSDAYFEWVRNVELYNYEDVEYKLYVPLKITTRAE